MIFNKLTNMFKNKINVHPINSKNIYHLYEPMLITLLIFGYNFDFYNENFIVKTAAKIYCVTLVSVVTYATVCCCTMQEISQFWSLLEYSSSVLIILFFKSQMRLFLENLSEVDVYLRIKRNHYLWDRYKIFILTLFIWLSRVCYTYLYCEYYDCYDDLALYVLSLLSPIALDLNRVWRYILFDTIRYRLKVLRMRLEENPENYFYLYIKDNKSIKEDKIRFCLKLYKTIADLVELVAPELHASLFMSVACNLPKLILNTYHILKVLEGLEPYESLGFIIMHIVQICVLLFSPFVVVEFYSVEVEKIRLFLMHKLINENDPQAKEELHLFMSYTQLRSFRYRIWRIIPINVALPLELINLCTTYVIVIINFTHLYG